MRHTDSRKVAVAGVLVAAVLAACVAMPTIGQLSAPSGWWLAAAIMGLPIAAVLVATGYRHYGLARSAAVAVTIAVITLVVTWAAFVYAFASALSGSAVGPVLGVVIYGTPALTVVVLGLLALKIVAGRASSDRQFVQAGSG